MPRYVRQTPSYLHLPRLDVEEDDEDKPVVYDLHVYEEEAYIDTGLIFADGSKVMRDDRETLGFLAHD